MADQDRFQMSQAHRKVLQQNHIFIKQNFTYEDGGLFQDYLQETGVLTDQLIELIKAERTEGSRVNRLLLFLPKRGPKAFDHFIEALKLSRHETVAEKLLDDANTLSPKTSIQANSSSAKSSVQATDVVKFQQGYDMVDRSVTSGREIRKLDPLSMDRLTNRKHYPMRKNPRGYAVIVNNWKFDEPAVYETREGSEFDAESLDTVFQELHFIVELKQNLLIEELEKYLENWSKDERLKESDAFVLVLMSHGDSRTTIVGRNGVKKSVDSLTKYFDGRHCQHLLGKPKIFIVQACRGETKTKGQQLTEPPKHDGPREPESVQSDVVVKMTVHEKSDMLYIYSTVDGFPAFRPKDGSWFIQLLCNELKEHACDTDLEQIVRQVTGKMKEKKSEFQNLQVPEVKGQGMDKLIYFFPGYYEQ